MLLHPATKADTAINDANVIAGRHEHTKLKSPALVPLTIGILRWLMGNRQAPTVASLNAPIQAFCCQRPFASGCQ
jgi:hypothetical protein